jgi:hypothetical protein
VQRRLDGQAVVDIDEQLGSGRQLAIERIDFGAHAAHYIERIGFRLRFYEQPHTRTTLGAHHGAFVLGRQPHLRHFAETHQMAFRAPPYHQVAKILFGVEPDFGAQRELARLRFEPARRQLHVLTA